jgi:hypothetical protein
MNDNEKTQRLRARRSLGTRPSIWQNELNETKAS